MAPLSDWYAFGPFRVEILKREVYRDGQLVKLGKMRFDLLKILLSNHGRAISNQEVYDSLWPNKTDPRQSLSNLFGHLCDALGDDDRQNPKYISHERDGCFRFVVKVEEGLATAPSGGHSKVLYVKVIHLRHKGSGLPAYRVRSHDVSRPIDVYDEALYYSLHMFPDKQPGWEWSIVSSGDPPTSHITYPWQPTPEYFDPYLATISANHINPRCIQSSATYLTLTTMYNGLQKGHEFVYAKVETDAQYVRIVVDFASLPDPMLGFKRRPYGVVEDARPAPPRPIKVDEPYPKVFTAVSDNLRKGQILRIKWSIDWDQYGNDELHGTTTRKARDRKRRG